MADANTPNIDDGCFHQIKNERLPQAQRATHAPRILLLYGSVRKRSFSRLMCEEAARILNRLGAETRLFDPSGLPLPDDAEPDHPRVQELRTLTTWCEGMVWCSPERHGAMTGIMKAQIDWIPLSIGAVRPTQGKTLAVMQVSGGSQSFNALNQLRVLGRQQQDEAVGFLRPRRRRHGGAGQVHIADARLLRLSCGSLFRAQGKRGRIEQTRQPAFDLSGL